MTNRERIFNENHEKVYELFHSKESESCINELNLMNLDDSLRLVNEKGHDNGQFSSKEEHSRVWICGQKWEQLDRLYVVGIVTN